MRGDNQFYYISLKTVNGSWLKFKKGVETVLKDGMVVKIGEA
jgi:hypothetical protein